MISLCLVAGACGGGEEDPAPQQDQTRPANFSLTMAVTRPGNLDPPRIATNSATIIASQLCDTLVAFDPRTGALKPGLAESWTIAPDARKATFRLRPGVKFHNGRDLVAEDFVYSLSRLANPATGSNQHFLLDKVVGYTEVRIGRSPALTGVKAPSPQVLEVELTEPFAEFPAIMSSVVAGSAVPREDVERSVEEFAAGPACTGPYRVGEASAEGIELVRFEDYHGASEGFQNGGRGLAEVLSFRFVEAESDAYKLLADGDVDVSPVPPEELAAAGQVANRVSSGPNGHVSYIGLPVKKPPFDNPNLRRALALSVDRKSIISGLLGNSRQTPDGLLPASAGPGADAETNCAAVSAENADTDAARAALAQPGVTAPEEMNLYLNSGGGHEQWLEAVAERWNEDLGIRGVLKPAEWDPYIDFLSSPGADGPFRLAWAVNFPSPEALYAPLFASSSLDNFSRYSSPEFDAAMNKARATVADRERAAAYAEAGAIVCRDLPIIPIWFGLDHLAFADGLQAGGQSRIDIFGGPILRELRPS
ncbi:ABC transporter substrate-binding protein [soil metagenome]